MTLKLTTKADVTKLLDFAARHPDWEVTKTKYTATIRGPNNVVIKGLNLAGGYSKAACAQIAERLQVAGWNEDLQARNRHRGKPKPGATSSIRDRFRPTFHPTVLTPDDLDLADFYLWTGDEHYVQRCQERGFHVLEGPAAIRRATHTTQDTDRADRRIAYCGDIRVVYNPTYRILITIMNRNVRKGDDTPTTRQPIQPRTASDAMLTTMTSDEIDALEAAERNAVEHPRHNGTPATDMEHLMTRVTAPTQEQIFGIYLRQMDLGQLFSGAAWLQWAASNYDMRANHAGKRLLIASAAGLVTPDPDRPGWYVVEPPPPRTRYTAADNPTARQVILEYLDTEHARRGLPFTLPRLNAFAVGVVTNGALHAALRTLALEGKLVRALGDLNGSYVRQPDPVATPVATPVVDTVAPAETPAPEAVESPVVADVVDVPEVPEAPETVEAPEADRPLVPHQRGTVVAVPRPPTVKLEFVDPDKPREPEPTTPAPVAVTFLADDDVPAAFREPVPVPRSPQDLFEDLVVPLLGGAVEALAKQPGRRAQVGDVFKLDLGGEGLDDGIEFVIRPDDPDGDRTRYVLVARVRGAGQAWTTL